MAAPSRPGHFGIFSKATDRPSVPPTPRPVARSTSNPTPSLSPLNATTITREAKEGTMQSLAAFFPPTRPATLKRKASVVSHVLPLSTPTSQTSAPTTIRRMRKSNLKLDRSRPSILLVEALLRKDTPELRELTTKLLANTTGSSKRDVGGVLEFDQDSRAKQTRLDQHIGTVNATLLLVCEHLLDNGALPSYTDADGNHALLLAVQYRKGAQLVGRLLAKGADANARCESCDAFSDLCMVDIALSLGAHDTVRELLLRGGLPSARAAIALLPFAATHGFGDLATARVFESYWSALTDSLDSDAVAAALTAGLHPELRDAQGKTGLCALMQLNRRSTSAATIELATLLCAHGADPNARHEGCPLAVWVIMRRGGSAAKLCRLLASWGLDPLATFIPEDASPETTLLAFAREGVGSDEVVAILEGLAEGAQQVAYGRRATLGVDGSDGGRKAMLKRGESTRNQTRHQKTIITEDDALKDYDLNAIRERFDSFTSSDLNVISKYGIRL